MCTLHVYTAGVLCATYDENSIVPQGGRSESCGAGTGGREGAARPSSPPERSLSHLKAHDGTAHLPQAAAAGR